MSFPPHLPPQSSSISLYRRAKWTLILLAVVLFSFLSAVAATLATIAWIVPVGKTPETLVFRNTEIRREEERKNADQAFVHDHKQRLLRVVDDRKKIAEGFYADEASVGIAVILTDDGWFVMRMPAQPSSGFMHWKAIDHKEDSFSVGEIVTDAEAGLLYGKLKGGAGFRVASFADQKIFGIDTPLYGAVLQKGLSPSPWPRVLLTGPEAIAPTDQSILIGRERYRLGLSKPHSPGAPLFTAEGTFAGFTDEEGRLLSVFFITEQYTNVFQQKKASYTGLPLRGRLVTDIAGKSAFAVTQAPTRATKNSVGAGDIITRVNDLPIDPVRLHEQILSSQTPVILTIMRKGEPIIISVEKTAVGA